MNRLKNTLKKIALFTSIVRRDTQRVVNRVHSRKIRLISPTEKGYQEYAKSIHEEIQFLGSMFGGCQGWALSGGLAIPLSLQQPIYREHRAIHIGVHPKNLEEFLLAAHNYKYHLFRRIWDIHIGMGKKLDFYEPITDEKFDKLSSTKNLRLIAMVDPRGIIHPHDTRLSYIDLYLHWNDQGKTHSNDDISRPGSDYFRGKQISTPHGPVPLVNLQYLAQRKSDPSARKDQRHVYDLKKLRESGITPYST